jgi:hypothetical protein
VKQDLGRVPIENVTNRWTRVQAWLARANKESLILYLEYRRYPQVWFRFAGN